MPLTKYNPFAELAEFSTPFRLFQDAVSRMLSEPSESRPWAPPVDIFETENDLVIKADLPGIDLNNIDVKVENGTLTLKGERKFERKEGSTEGYHRIERGYGSFVRCFSLPESVDPEKVSADFKSGVLTITMAKKEIAKPRSIKVAVHE